MITCRLKFRTFYFNYFRSLILETFYLTSDKFRTDISDKNVGHFAETFVPTKQELERNNIYENCRALESLHRQGFTDST